MRQGRREYEKDEKERAERAHLAAVFERYVFGGQ